MARKVFVSVIVRYNEAGRARPLKIFWEDGRAFEVDRVLDVRPAPALQAGGRGMRYPCRIANRDMYLFEDENRWFVEAR